VTAVCPRPDAKDLYCADLLPTLSLGDAKMKLEAVVKWIKGLPIGKRSLVKSSVLMAGDEAVRAMQVGGFFRMMPAHVLC
jgi:hypothetical protein